jgi:hypothetical protein
MNKHKVIYLPLEKVRTRPAARKPRKVKDHRLTVGCTYFDEKPVPLIRLSGVWLDRQGFSRGKEVIVREQPGRLLIELAEEAN